MVMLVEDNGVSCVICWLFCSFWVFFCDSFLLGVISKILFLWCLFRFLIFRIIFSVWFYGMFVKLMVILLFIVLVVIRLKLFILVIICNIWWIGIFWKFNEMGLFLYWLCLRFVICFLFIGEIEMCSVFLFCFVLVIIFFL